MKPLVAIVGPTAIGKSALALNLSEKLGGEIINADSRQVYRYMDIGTAKPTTEERRRVLHHMIDVVDPDQVFNLARYQEEAGGAIQTIQAKGRVPFLVGGSGLYVWSVLEGWQIPRVAPDVRLRQDLESRARSGEAAQLFEELRSLDPVAAERIDPRNTRRIIRAIEVSRRGIPFSRLQLKKHVRDYVIIGLTTARDSLYRLIDSRIDAMMKAGFLDEVKHLIEMGYGLDLPSMSGLGYRQLGEYLNGKTDLQTAVEKTKFDTHRFSRHQYNWFRLNDSRITWFDTGPHLVQDVLDHLQQGIASTQ